jgi:serine/threonine protein kinase
MDIQIYNEGEATAYDLIEEIRGGQEGRTWRARQIGPDDRALAVAVKVLTRDSWLNQEVDPEEMLRKWRGQMQVMRNFGHRGFAPVQVAFPIGFPPDNPTATPEWMLGAPAFVMAWIDGVTLVEWSAREADPLERLRALEVCADGLDHFHRVTGHVHRDLKPENIMVQDGVARIVDYGLIRSLDDLRTHSAATGSRPYMDPALFEGAEYSTVTDLFSFAGVILYQLTLKHPVPGRLAPKIQGELINEGFQSVAQLIAYSLSPDPAYRPQVDGAADLLAKTIALMQPAPKRTATPIEVSRSPLDDVTVPASPQVSEPETNLRTVAWPKIVAPLLVAGMLTVLVVLLLRALTA